MSEGRYYSEDVIEELIEHNDIVDVVSEYVKVTKKGKDFFGLCPFHREKTPSFSVVPSKQIFYCFGCGKGGNVIQFIKNIENIEYIDAIRFLADKSSFDLPISEDKEQAKKEQKIKLLAEINKEAAKYFYALLKQPVSMQARKYLLKRGLTKEIVNQFGMGFAPDSYQELSDHLKSKGYEEKDIISAGLGFYNRQNKITDRFRDRVMFPIFDIRKRVIGFGGRALSEKGAKYMNSPETPLYHKSSSLYGIHIAKEHAKQGLIIVEGYMDCIALHQAGISHCVAALGTALTQRQARILKKMTNDITIAFDSDAAGQAAALRSLDLLSDMGLSVKVIVMDKGKDPDDYIRDNGVKAFEKIIDQAKPLVEYKAFLAKKKINTDTTEGSIRFLNEMAKAIAKVDNEMEKEMYVKKIASEYGISEESLMHEIDKNRSDPQVRSGHYVKRNKSEQQKETNNQKKKHFYAILAVICAKPNLIEYLFEEMEEEFLTETWYIEVFDRLKQRVNQSKRIDENHIVGFLDDDETAQFLGVSAAIGTSSDWGRTLTHKINDYKTAVLKEKITAITLDLDQIEEDDEKKQSKQNELLHHIHILKNIKSHKA